MVGPLILRGLLAGVVAGLLAFAFAWSVGEPQVDRAIAFESAHAQGHSHHHEGAPEQADHHDHPDDHAHDHHPATPAGDADADGELFSRGVQSTVGLLTGVVVYGAALGGLFALAYAACLGRVGGPAAALGPRGLSLLLALLGFVVLALAPGLKYPANPPAVGLPDTIRLRTGLFFLDLAASLGLGLLAWNVAGRLRARLGAWDAGLAGIALFIVATALIHALLPDVQEVPPDFPAVVLWRFRLAALGLQGVLWLGVGLVFGRLVAKHPPPPHAL